MQTKHALYITDLAIIFCDIDADGVKEVFSHALTDAHYIEKLQAFLSGHKPESFSVYLDVMGEEFKHESIPHIGGKDRELLLDRKCKSLLASADLTWRKHLRREKKGRKDDVYLIVGLPLPSSVEHVFDVLIESHQMISGVYSISILAREIQAILPASQQNLVVSRVLGSPTGRKVYRQTFFKDGELTMSRVTSINGETSDQIFSQLISEIERMHHFLAGTRQVNNELTLDVCTTLGPQETEQLARHQSDSDKIAMSDFHLTDIARNKGLKEKASFSSLVELLIALSASKNLIPHFKPEGLCASFNRVKAKRGLNVIAIAVLVVSVAVSSFFAFTASTGKDKLEVLIIELAQLDEQKKALLDNAQITEIEPVKMKQVVDLYKEIHAHQYAPDDVLEVLSRAYKGFGDVSLIKLSWLKQTSGAQNTRRGRGNGEPFLNTLKPIREFELKVSLSSQLSNRMILERVTDFSKALNNQPEINSVTRETATLDTGSNARLAESLGGAVSNKPVEFTLLIVMALS